MNLTPIHNIFYHPQKSFWGLDALWLLFCHRGAYIDEPLPPLDHWHRDMLMFDYACIKADPMKVGRDACQS